MARARSTSAARRLRALSVLALALSAFAAPAAQKPAAQKQSEAAVVQALNLHQWGAVTLFHGLPSDRVRAIAQDAEGVLWFGTDSGLAKYDGRRTQTVAVEGLSAGRVLALGFDAGEGALWVGTEGGAGVLREGVWRAVEETKGKPVTSIMIEGGGRALLATAAGQVFECAIETAGRDAASRVSSASGAEESDDESYFTEEPSVVIRARAFPAQPLRSADSGGGELELTSLARGPDGALYAGTRGRGLLVMRGESFEEVAGRPRPFFVEALGQDADGELWIGARGGAAGLYAAGKGAGPRKLAEVQSAVGVVKRGAGGDLWIGTAGQGALRFRGGRLAEQFTFEGTAGGLRSDNVYTIFIDREGVVWFGTDRGVCRFDSRSPRNETISSERESNFARALLRTRAGELLCGTNRGLFAYDGRAAAWSRVEASVDKTVHALAEDARGRLLVGTSDGLYAGAAGGGRTLERQEAEGPEAARASLENLQPRESPEGLKAEARRERVESVRAIREHRGATYVAVYERGVERIDGERRTLVWPPRDSDAALREVTSLHAEAGGRLWIGTAGAGLYASEGASARRAFGEALRGQAVWAVEGTAAAGLWVATSAGLHYSRDGATLEMIVRDVDARAVSADENTPGGPPSVWVATAGAGLLRVRLDPQLGPVVSRLDVEQGLASSHAFALLRQSSDADGEAAAAGAAAERPAETESGAAGAPASLVVGTTRGVVRYRPGATAPALMPVRVLSRRLHQPRELRAGFTLPYPQNSLALDVAALSTRTFPEQFQYVFTLRAGDGREIRRKLSGEAQFVMENLPPGEYAVEARAFTKDLTPSRPLSFAFTVARAPFPRTVAALAVLLLLALVALLWGAWQNRKMARATAALAEANHELAGARLNLANEAERERRRIARDLHDQTLADLRSLMLLTDQLPAGDADGDGARDASAAGVTPNAPGAAGPGVAVGPAAFRSEIESISDEIRRICEDLSPSALDNVGLAAALEWALTNSAAHCREPERFEYEFAADEDFDERLQVAPGVRMQIYRIAQEAVTNVCRHARARRVRLSVTISPAGELLLALEDDGRSDFDPRARSARRGRGLSSIRDRASLIEAEAAWERLDGGGTRFTLRKANAAKTDAVT